MRRTALALATASLLAAPCAAPPDPVVDADPDTATPQTLVADGSSDLKVEKKGDTWSAGPLTIEAPLPVGYPAPTAPGLIEVKAYPAARRASYSSTMNPDRGTGVGFWPLFEHIKDRDIPMTSPVEVDYLNFDDAKNDTSKMRWSMGFLYQSTEVGKIESDDKVAVTDTPPMTVLALAHRGPYGFAKTREGVEQLQAWLANHPEWEASGPPRSLFYNGPYIRVKWSEVQIPVRPASPKELEAPEAPKAPTTPDA